MKPKARTRNTCRESRTQLAFRACVDREAHIVHPPRHCHTEESFSRVEDVGSCQTGERRIHRTLPCRGPHAHIRFVNNEYRRTRLRYQLAGRHAAQG
jgi:hypothetical protein